MPNVPIRLLSEFTGFSDEKLKKHGVFQTERFFLDVYCLKPGQAQKPHAHARSDKVYVVLEGRCRFTIGETVSEQGPGAVVLAEAGVAHGVETVGMEGARLLVLMSPPPEHG